MQYLDIPNDLKSLVFLNGDAAYTDTLAVAKRFDKRHDNVIRALESLNCSERFRQKNYILTTGAAQIGSNATRETKVYEMTKDGFMYLVLGFTGDEADRTKEAFLEAFNWLLDSYLNNVKLEAEERGRNLGMSEGIKLEHDWLNRELEVQLKDISYDLFKAKHRLELTLADNQHLISLLQAHKIPVSHPRKIDLPKFISDVGKSLAAEIRAIVDEGSNPFISEDGISSTALRAVMHTKIPAPFMTSDINEALTYLGYEKLARISVKGGDKHMVWVRKDDTRQELNKIMTFKKRVDMADPE